MSISGIGIGTCAPLGATVQPGGVNFSIYSKNAESVELLLFDGGDALKPARVMTLDPRKHRTYYYWHKAGPAFRPRQAFARSLRSRCCYPEDI
jgi:isoamylase